MIFGFFVISYRHPTVYAVVYLASAFFIVAGVFQIIGSIRIPVQRWLHIIFGLFWIGAGIVGFVWPHITIFICAVLQPVEDELWAEADDVLERPGRWASAGATWGPRALVALHACAG